MFLNRPISRDLNFKQLIILTWYYKNMQLKLTFVTMLLLCFIQWGIFFDSSSGGADCLNICGIYVFTVFKADWKSVILFVLSEKLTLYLAKH